MPSIYRVVLFSEILDMLLHRIRSSERERVIDFFETLANRPSMSGDYEETDSDGRINQVKIVGRWAITYWPDHAVREIRVVRIESA